MYVKKIFKSKFKYPGSAKNAMFLLKIANC